MARRSRSSNSNFRCSPLYTWAAVVSGMTLTGVLACCPEVLPYSILGPVGTFLHYIAYEQSTLISITFFAASGVHIIEGVAAYWMCRRMKFNTRDTLLWTLQTVALGVGSLLPLRAIYKRKVKSQ